MFASEEHHQGLGGYQKMRNLKVFYMNLVVGQTQRPMRKKFVM